MAETGFVAGVLRQCRLMASRKLYVFGMLIVPIAAAVFFLSILNPGLPLHIPSAVVDFDHSPMSRAVTRSLSATQNIDVDHHCESYDDALREIRQGKIFGFFVIPDDFEKNTLSGKTPTLEYYSNMTYFVPGTLAFKGFKSVAVATSMGVVQQTLQSVGVDGPQARSLMAPVAVDINGLSNPWMSYSIYLCPSFTMAVFVLMIMLMTAFTVTMEIKNGTSREWLSTSGDSILVAVTSKLLPMTVAFTAVGIFIQWLFFGYSHFPMHGSIGWMLFATFLSVVASQSLALFFASIVPNPRLSLTLCALTGILAFSFTGFSFPVESMYGWLAVLSWFAPVRYWFLIYINEALNGYALYYSRFFYVALLLFPLVCSTALWNLKRACKNPVYLP